MITFAEGSYAIRIPAFQNDEHTIWHVDQNGMIEVIYSIIEITKKKPSISFVFTKPKNNIRLAILLMTRQFPWTDGQLYRALLDGMEKR